jgi:DNA-binding transcriptional ArsR family regulator
MNTLTITQITDQTAYFIQAFASPARIAILLTVGTGEACVCHLEAALGWRQAYISQHLMALRKADILRDRRDGRFIYYRLANPSILELVLGAAQMSGIDAENVNALINSENNPSCECPNCADQQLDKLITQPPGSGTVEIGNK